MVSFSKEAGLMLMKGKIVSNVDGYVKYEMYPTDPKPKKKGFLE